MEEGIGDTFPTLTILWEPGLKVNGSPVDRYATALKLVREDGHATLLYALTGPVKRI